MSDFSSDYRMMKASPVLLPQLFTLRIHPSDLSHTSKREGQAAYVSFIKQALISSSWEIFYDTF